MATPSKQPKLANEILTEQNKEKKIIDLENQLEKQKVENQNLKNQLAYHKEKVHEKEESLKINEENIAELKSQIDLVKEKPLFGDLPDEVQLKILKFLGIEDIVHCAQVSKRTRRICNDESIWEKINLSNKVVPSDFIDHILQKGCKYISLAMSTIVGGLNLSRNDYGVKYLDVSMCKADEGVLEKLINSCQSLQKLSLCHMELNPNAMKSLCHQTLQTLDLSCFEGLNLELTTNILSCQTLTEVSFRSIVLDYVDDANNFVQYLVENLSSDIKKVSLGDIDCLTDEHVNSLVKRCKNIQELELWGCRNITENSLTSIVEHCDQMVKLDVSLTNIGFSRNWNDELRRFELLPVQGRNPFLKVKSMPKLKVLDCQHTQRSSQETENLRNLMPGLKINESKSSIGRDLCIANPNESFKTEDGLWDIFVKRTELFLTKYSR